MAKNKPIVDQDPQGGGSYTRNEDGTLTKNEQDTQTTPAKEQADETTKD